MLNQPGLAPGFSLAWTSSSSIQAGYLPACFFHSWSKTVRNPVAELNQFAGRAALAVCIALTLVIVVAAAWPA